MPDTPNIPEYYRHLVEKKPEAAPSPPSPCPPPAPPPQAAPSGQAPKPAAVPRPAPGPAAAAGRRYDADTFALTLPAEGWADKTVYTLGGPVADGLQHGITITLARDLPPMSLAEYAAMQREALEQSLHGCRVLLQDQVVLDSGLPAARFVFRWEPSEARRVYQQQLLTLVGETAYTLAATFTKKTRKTLGPQADRVMRSFTPREQP